MHSGGSGFVGNFVPLYDYFFFNDTATTEIYTLSLHDALPISAPGRCHRRAPIARETGSAVSPGMGADRSEEHTSELQSHSDLVCRLLLEKKKRNEASATATATGLPFQTATRASTRKSRRAPTS